MPTDKELKVSICCLTYNHVGYLENALDGFLMQECDFDFEIIIHDDASTDGTAKVLKKYQEKYPDKIKPIYQTENQWSKGVRPSPTYVWPRTKGKYIAICEGDDFWTDPNKLQKQVDFLDVNPDFGLVHTDRSNYYQNSKVTVRSNKTRLYPDPPSGYIFDDLLVVNFISTLTVMVRRDLLLASANKMLDIIDSNLFIDYTVWLEVSRNTKIKYLDDITATYRISANSMSNPIELKKQKLWRKKVYSIQDTFIDLYKVDDKLTQKIYDIRFREKLKKQYQKEFFEKEFPEKLSTIKILKFKELLQVYAYKLKLPRIIYIIIEFPDYIKRKLLNLF